MGRALSYSIHQGILGVFWGAREDGLAGMVPVTARGLASSGMGLLSSPVKWPWQEKVGGKVSCICSGFLLHIVVRFRVESCGAWQQKRRLRQKDKEGL